MSDPKVFNRPVLAYLKDGSQPPIETPRFFNGQKYQILLIDEGLERCIRKGWRIVYKRPAYSKASASPLNSGQSPSGAPDPPKVAGRRLIVVHANDQRKVCHIGELLTDDNLPSELYKIAVNFSTMKLSGKGLKSRLSI